MITISESGLLVDVKSMTCEFENCLFGTGKGPGSSSSSVRSTTKCKIKLGY